LRGERVLFAPNPGNAGDALIACATYRLFDKLGIQYEKLRLDCPVAKTKGQILLYGGGGNLVDLYGDAREFLARHHRGARKLIVLPHTVLGHADLLVTLGSNVTVICREKASYGFVQRFAAATETLLMDDVAFGLDAEALLRLGDQAYWPARTSPDYFWHGASEIPRWLAQAVGNITDAGVLNAFRTDNEKSSAEIPPDNIDVSLVFESGDLSPRRAAEASCRLLKFLRRFARIRTNRLHVCIAALLLGKKVDFFPNSYGKNQFVYDFSMSGGFPLLIWHGAEERQVAIS
jgi:exopolysaccharide biosynthesis predicted pyruvyltransferase EpsI